MTSRGEVYLDSSYATALGVPKDEHHGRAVELARQLESNSVRMVTSRAVVLEIGNALSRSAYRAGAVALLADMEADRDVEIVPLIESLYSRAFEMFRQYRDQEWGLTDCVSFVIMHDRGLTDALTADKGFVQAGFRALLLEP